MMFINKSSTSTAINGLLQTGTVNRQSGVTQGILVDKKLFA